MCALRLAGRRGRATLTYEQYDVIHKTVSTLRVKTLSEEDRATAIGNRHKKIGEDRTCSSEDTIRQRL